MRSQPTADTADRADQESLRFRAPTLDEAVATAEEALGGRVKVLEANKIRRGGLGGFFASDLGVEVTVVPEDESVEDALERLVARSGAEDRWESTTLTSRLDAIAHEVASAASAASAASVDDHDDDLSHDDFVVDIASPEMSMKALRKMVDLTSLTSSPAPAPLKPMKSSGAAKSAAGSHAAAAADAVVDSTTVPRAKRRLQAPAEMVSAQDIVAELKALTTTADVSFGQVQEATDRLHARTDAENEADLTSRLAAPRKRLGSPSSANVAAVPVAAAQVVEPPAVEVVVPEIMTPEIMTPEIVVAEIAAPVVVAPVVVAPVVAAPVAVSMPVIETRTEVVPVGAIDVLPAARPQRPAGAPSRRHVELTLAAADQLIDSLARSGNVQRLSVRVVLRSGDHREVEAEAQWEAAPVVGSALPASSTEAA